MNARLYSLRAGDRVLELGTRPWLMGIVNASPDSFSDRAIELGHGDVDAHAGEVVNVSPDSLGDREVELGHGDVDAHTGEVVNALPDSLGDREIERGHGDVADHTDDGRGDGRARDDGRGDGRIATLERQVRVAEELVRAGADILDVGGESARTDTDVVPAEIEIERVAPLIERITNELDTIVSVDTYKPQVAAAAIDAGARIVNDVSGLRNAEIARVCAETGAALVVMHTSAAPKQRLQDPELYGEDICEEVLRFLERRIETALAAGVEREQLIVDPGPDFAKTPAQTIALLAGIDRLHALQRPILMAVSRKDFIGALTSTPPRRRLSGTLAALAHGLDHGAHVYRLHDVSAAAEYIAVREALSGAHEPCRDLALAEEHRYEPRREER